MLTMQCHICAGTGEHNGLPCEYCDGTGTVEVAGDAKIQTQYALAMYELLGDVPTKAQLLDKFNDLQGDIDLLKQGVQAIWNKVKDM